MAVTPSLLLEHVRHPPASDRCAARGRNVEGGGVSKNLATSAHFPLETSREGAWSHEPVLDARCCTARQAPALTLLLRRGHLPNTPADAADEGQSRTSRRQQQEGGRRESGRREKGGPPRSHRTRFPLLPRSSSSLSFLLTHHARSRSRYRNHGRPPPPPLHRRTPHRRPPRLGGSSSRICLPPHLQLQLQLHRGTIHLRPIRLHRSFRIPYQRLPVLLSRPHWYRPGAKAGHHRCRPHRLLS